MADYTAHKNAYSPKEPDRTTVEQEFAWLDSLVKVERASVERVEEAGVFADVTERDVDEAAVAAVRTGDVMLRRGWEGCFGLGMNCTVLSVNWSGRFIRASLEAGLEMEGLPGKQVIDVQANEIRGRGKTTRYFGGHDRGIWTSGDKVQVMKKSLYLDRERPGKGKRESRSIYIGDSTTDLGCLLEADVGISMRCGASAESLKKALDRLGIVCRSISAYEHKLSTSGSLWWTNDFSEIWASPLGRELEVSGEQRLG